MQRYILNKLSFLAKYNLDTSFLESGYEWEEIVEIVDDYWERKESLNETVEELFSKISCLANIAYIKKRTKHYEHLAEKVIRKACENKGNGYHRIRVNDYIERVTDLIGFRLIHVFREDWCEIHEQLMNAFSSFVEKPCVILATTDDKGLYSKYKDTLEFSYRESGYRSVHYMVKQDEYVAEIQVRTVFQEGWGEVEHALIYPSRQNDDLLRQYSDILNHVTDVADTISSKIRHYIPTHDQRIAKEQCIESNIHALSDLINDCLIEKGKKEALKKIINDIRSDKLDLVPFMELVTESNES